MWVSYTNGSILFATFAFCTKKDILEIIALATHREPPHSFIWLDSIPLKDDVLYPVSYWLLPGMFLIANKNESMSSSEHMAFHICTNITEGF